MTGATSASLDSIDNQDRTKEQTTVRINEKKNERKTLSKTKTKQTKKRNRQRKKNEKRKRKNENEKNEKKNQKRKRQQTQKPTNELCVNIIIDFRYCIIIILNYVCILFTWNVSSFARGSNRCCLLARWLRISARDLGIAKANLFPPSRFGTF